MVDAYFPVNVQSRPFSAAASTPARRMRRRRPRRKVEASERMGWRQEGPMTGLGALGLMRGCKVAVGSYPQSTPLVGAMWMRVGG